MRMGECPVRPYLSAPFRTVRGRGRLCMFPVRRASVFRLSSSNPGSQGGASGSCGTRSAGERQHAGAYASQAPMGWARARRGVAKPVVPAASQNRSSRSHEQRHFQLLGTLSPGLQVWSFITHRLPAGLMRTLHCLLGASLFECPKVEKSSAICVLCGGFASARPIVCGEWGAGSRGWAHRRALVCCRSYKRAMGAMHAPRIR